MFIIETCYISVGEIILIKLKSVYGRMLKFFGVRFVMSDTVVWGLAGIIISILLAFLGAKRLTIGGKKIVNKGKVDGDIFIGIKNKEE